MSNKKDLDLGNRLYSGAASFGRFTTLITCIFISLFGAIFVYAGIKLYQIEYNTVKAKVNDVKCTQNCSVSVTYTYEGETVTQPIETTNKNISAGSEITVYISKDDKNNKSLDNPKTGPKIFIGVGIFIILIAWFIYWITTRYEFAAAAVGVSDAVSIISYPFSD